MKDSNTITQDDVTRALPHALGPEKSLLSTMLQDPREFIPVAIEERITPAHFYVPAHALLFETLLAEHDTSEEIELVSLTQKLLDRGMLDRIGGPAALADLYTYAPSPGSFRHHLAHVRDKFILRSLIRVANDTTAAAYDAPEEAAELLDATESAILAIRETGDTGKAGTIREAVDGVLAEMRQIIRGELKAVGISTGFQRLDAMTGGLKPGDMFVIAARPSMGKTALMMNIIEHVSVDQGLPAMVFSLEMTRHKLTKRVLYPRARLSTTQVTEGFNPNKGELQRIERASMDLARSPLVIDETDGITLTELRAKARRQHRKHGLRLIAIDYLQLMKSRTRQAQNSREREIAEISAGIKALAKELGIPIIILAQLNRGPESRNGQKSNTPAGVPRLSDLRESGAIEQDADMVGLLYRSAYYAETEAAKAEEAGHAALILAKNRNGETGRVPLTFIEQFTRFEEGEPARAPVAPPQPKSRFAFLEK